MGTVRVAWKSQLSRTKKGNEVGGTAMEIAGLAAVMGPVFSATTRLVPGGKKASEGGVKALRRVYLPRTDRRGRNDAHAPSTRAAALRRLSIDAFACQLVWAARCPA